MVRTSPTHPLVQVLQSVYPIWLVRVVPYMFAAAPIGIAISADATILLFAVSAGKTLITGRSWWRSGLESMAIGTAAGIVTYGAGRLFARR